MNDLDERLWAAFTEAQTPEAKDVFAPPKDAALTLAKRISTASTRGVARVDGCNSGMRLGYQQSNRYAYVECYNDGEVLLMLRSHKPENRGRAPKVLKVGFDPVTIHVAIGNFFRMGD